LVQYGELIPFDEFLDGPAARATPTRRTPTDDETAEPSETGPDGGSV